MAKLKYPSAQVKFKVATPVSLSGLPAELARAINKIQSTVTVQSGDSEKNKIVSMAAGTYIQALRWLVKEKWKQSLRVGDLKLDGNERNARKSGQYFRAVLELCKECHTFQNQYSEPYKNASEWLMAIVIENWEAELEEIFTPLEERTLSIRDANKKIQYEVTAIKHGHIEEGGRRNPFDPNAFPHLSRLIECSIALLAENGEAWEAFMVGSKKRDTQKAVGLGFLRTYQALKLDSASNLPVQKQRSGSKTEKVRQAQLAWENEKAIFVSGKRKETIPDFKYLRS